MTPCLSHECRAADERAASKRFDNVSRAQLRWRPMNCAALPAEPDPSAPVDDAFYTGLDHSQDPAEPVEKLLHRLPIAGVSRRRVAWVIGAVVSLWIVAVFARQVGDASAAAARADEIRAQNAAIAQQVTELERERTAIQQRSFVQFMARGYGLGNRMDHRFSLAANAPPLPSDAPGSSVLDAAGATTSELPFDSWMSLLFGPPPQHGN